MMIVWLWDASGPAAAMCGAAGTAEAARRAAGSELTSGRAETARLEQAALVIGRELTYDYCPTGRTWTARLAAGRPAVYRLRVPRAVRAVTNAEVPKYARAAGVVRTMVNDGAGPQAGPARAERRDPGPAHRLLCHYLPPCAAGTDRAGRERLAPA